MGKNAGWKVAVRCESCLASENVSSYTPLNRSGRLHLWRPFLLFIRSVPRPFQTYPHRCEVGRYRPRPSRSPNQHPVQRLKTFNPISSATFFKTAKFNCCKTIVAGSSRHPFYIRSISAGDIGYPIAAFFQSASTSSSPEFGPKLEYPNSMVER